MMVFYVFIFLLSMTQIKGIEMMDGERKDTSIKTETSIAYNAELISAVRECDIKSIKKAVKNGALDNFTPPPEYQTKRDFLIFLNEILDILQFLIAQDLAFVAKGGSENADGAFNVSLVKGTDLIVKLQLNGTAIRKWNDGEVPGRTPLHIICSMPYITNRTVHFLLENGADINARTDKNITALHVAVEVGNLELVKYLVEAGADVNVSARIPMESKNATSFMKLFVKDKKIIDDRLDFVSTPLNAAILTGRDDIARYLLEQGAAADSEGDWSPLQVAAVYGRAVIVRILIEAGVEVERCDSVGQTALHKAASAGWLEVARVLVGNGAEVDQRDRYGWTPLQWAAFSSPAGSRAIVELFLEAGAEPESEVEGAFSPLELAAAGGYLALARLLAEGVEGGEIEAAAAAVGRVEVMRVLLDGGANLDHQDSILGWTAMHWAASAGDLEVVKLLLGSGTDLSVRSSQGQTAQDLARHWGRRVVYDYLKEQSAFS